MERGGCWVIIGVHSLAVGAAISREIILKEELIIVSLAKYGAVPVYLYLNSTY